MAALTRDRQGQHVPKQYCRFGPGGSLLQRALRRAARHSDASHTLVVVQEAHREWWAPVLAHLPQENILVQPTNQGTGVALLHVVSHVLEHDRDPYLLVMPSDHEVDDEDLWRETLRHALRAVHESPDHLVMVGRGSS
jgi:mannose-1-phosphate guanylyltransferase